MRLFRHFLLISALVAGTASSAQTNAAINCFLGGIRPNESLHDTIVTFQNNAETSVDILWVSFEGEEVYYNTLAPGDSYDQPSFYGHPWVIYRAESNICKAIIIPFAPHVVLTID
ncbi:MAG: hypothetical protein JKY31_01520 [Rhodobacteraceae bacterium]|nr:hypothetical protein [Paracoccaceae bacterium]